MDPPHILKLSVFVPVRTVNLTNTRESFWTTHKRSKEHKSAVLMCFSGKKLPPLPVKVLLDRHGVQLIDTDSMPTATKSLRDQIAKMYGVDDGPREPCIAWLYDQRTVKKKDVGVMVSIETLEVLLGRPVLTEADCKLMPCPFPPEPNL